MPYATKELNSLREKIKSKMTKETPDKELTEYGEMLKDIDNIETQVNDLEKEQLDYREKYIESVKNFGTGKAPYDDKPKAPRSLEDIAQEVISKDKK